LPIHITKTQYKKYQEPSLGGVRDSTISTISKMPVNLAPGEGYSGGIALIMIFNLIVGVGALALPYGFQAAGIVIHLNVVLSTYNLV
jgi:hypothetical protein